MLHPSFDGFDSDSSSSIYYAYQAMLFASVEPYTYPSDLGYTETDSERTKISTTMDMRRDPGAVGLGAICRQAKKDGARVYLSGTGADEIISDYGFGGKKIVPHSAFGGLFPEDLESVYPWNNFFGGTQRAYLMKEEYVAGAFGLEARYPFLDFNVVQEFLWLKSEVKNARYKGVIAEILEGMGFDTDWGRKLGFSPNAEKVTEEVEETEETEETTEKPIDLFSKYPHPSCPPKYLDLDGLFHHHHPSSRPIFERYINKYPECTGLIIMEGTMLLRSQDMKGSESSYAKAIEGLVEREGKGEKRGELAKTAALTFFERNRLKEGVEMLETGRRAGGERKRPRISKVRRDDKRREETPLSLSSSQSFCDSLRRCRYDGRHVHWEFRYLVGPLCCGLLCYSRWDQGSQGLLCVPRKIA